MLKPDVQISAAVAAETSLECYTDLQTETQTTFELHVMGCTNSCGCCIVNIAAAGEGVSLSASASALAVAVVFAPAKAMYLCNPASPAE